MKTTKHLLVIFLAIQLFAAPIVKSCIGMASLTEKSCCPPDDCACDVTAVDVDSSVDAIKIDFNLKPQIVLQQILHFEEILPEFTSSVIVLNLDLPPPLKRDSELQSFYQVYIL